MSTKNYWNRLNKKLRFTLLCFACITGLAGAIGAVIVLRGYVEDIFTVDAQAAIGENKKEIETLKTNSARMETKINAILRKIDPEMAELLISKGPKIEE